LYRLVLLESNLSREVIVYLWNDIALACVSTIVLEESRRPAGCLKRYFTILVLAHLSSRSFQSPPFMYKLLVGLLLCGFLGKGLAQPDLSSLIETWTDVSLPTEKRFEALNELHAEFYLNNPDTVLHFLEELRILAEQLDHQTALYSAYNRRGNILRMQGLDTEALKAYNDAEVVACSIGDSLRLATVYANRGNVHVQLTNYVEATHHFSEALEIHRQHGHVKGQRNMHMALGNVFTLIDHFDLAKAQYALVLKEIEGESDNGYFPGLLKLNMGWCEFKLGNFDRASELYLSSLAILEKEEALFFLAGCHGNLSALRQEQGRAQEAMQHAITCTEMYGNLGARGDELYGMLTIADLTLLSDPAEALRLAQDIQEELLEESSHQSKSELYRLLYQAFKGLGDESNALEMHEMFVLYDDSLQTEKHRLAVLRAAYEKDVEHQLQAVQWEGEKEQSRQEIKQLKTVLALVLGFLIVIGTLITYIVKIQRRHRGRRNELMTQIEELHNSSGQKLILETPVLELDQARLNQAVGRTLNETDWKVLNILLQDPTMTNRGIADKAYLSIDGIGSSLRRMYGYFEVKETKYKKMALLHAAMKVSAGEGYKPH
jgi:tetratricopeptide (TPR) repeat protein